MKQTAIEWLIEELGEYFPHGIGGIEYMVKKAKEIEKEQIINAWMATDNELQRIAAEQYYNETYRR
jgi:hypothetical protein